MKKSTIMTSLKQIIDTYNARGFKVKHIQMPQKNPGITRHNAQCHYPRLTRPRGKKVHPYHKGKSMGNS